MGRRERNHPWQGYGADGKLDFAWGDNITREEIAVMLERLA